MGEKPLGQRPVLGDQPRLASRLPYRFDAAITAALTPPSTKDVAVFYYTHSYDSNLGHQDIPYLNRNKIPILATIAVGSIILVGGVTLCLVTAAGFCTAIAPGEEATGQAATTLFPGLGDIPTGAEAGNGAADLIGGANEFDPASLTGETPDAIRARIPDDWVSSPSKSGGGEVFSDPANPGRQIRIMPGYGEGVRPDPLTAGPYAVVSQNGVVTKIPLAGNPTLP